MFSKFKKVIKFQVSEFLSYVFSVVWHLPIIKIRLCVGQLINKYFIDNNKTAIICFIEYYQNQLRYRNPNHTIYIIFDDEIGKLQPAKYRFEAAKYKEFSVGFNDQIDIPKELYKKHGVNSEEIGVFIDKYGDIVYGANVGYFTGLIIFYKQKKKLGFVFGSILAAIISFVTTMHLCKIYGVLNEVILKIIDFFQ